MADLIYRDEAELALIEKGMKRKNLFVGEWMLGREDIHDALAEVPAAEPTLYGYNIEHLGMIARVLQKEDLPPERLSEILTDIGRIVTMVLDELEEALRKAVEQ